MKKSLLIGLSIIGLTTISCSNLSNSSQAQVKTKTETTQVKSSAVTANQPFDYQDYADVLAQYVDERGLVNYVELQANRAQLDRFNQSLGTVTPETFDSWGESEQIAFLSNAYNSFTLQSIIDQDPLKESIRDISGVWKKRKFALAGEEQTLDNIEHDILRKDYNEPRIHVALVCAAISCPILRNEPYTAESLDAQLDDQTAKFASSPHGFEIDREDKKVYLSSIFKWYGKDFIKTYGNDDEFSGNAQQRAVLKYFNSKLSPEDRKFIASKDYKVKYLDYDWSLNKQ